MQTCRRTVLGLEIQMVFIINLRTSKKFKQMLRFHNGAVIVVRFALMPYKIRVRRQNQKDYLILDNLNGQSLDTLDLLHDFLTRMKRNPYIGRDDQKTLSVEKINPDGRLLYGIIKSGEFGMKLDFLDTETGRIEPEARKEKHSEPLPFFFAIHILPGKDMGLLILQVFKGLGIKSVLEDLLNTYFKSKGFSISLNPMFSQDLLEELRQGRLVKFRLRKVAVARDPADRIHEGSRDDIEQELVIGAKVGKQIQLSGNIIETLREMLSDQEVRYFEILDEQYDQAKAVIEKDEQTKTLTFGPDNKMRESMPLTNIPNLEGGFPSYSFLLEKAKAYLRDIYRKHELG